MAISLIPEQNSKNKTYNVSVSIIESFRWIVGVLLKDKTRNVVDIAEKVMEARLRCSVTRCGNFITTVVIFRHFWRIVVIGNLW